MLRQLISSMSRLNIRSVSTLKPVGSNSKTFCTAVASSIVTSACWIAGAAYLANRYIEKPCTKTEWLKLTPHENAYWKMKTRNRSMPKHPIEICDWLRNRGIQAEQSEEGARQGLAQYVVKHLQRGANVHAESKCRCHLSPAPQ